jgi:hemoglobin
VAGLVDGGHAYDRVMAEVDSTTGEQPESIYERVGGRAFFERLVSHFYEQVASDPILRPMYPDELEPAEARLSAFLVQYFGGPPDYAVLRGEPRLRMRHMEFPITADARDAWMEAMSDAVARSGADEEVAAVLLEYFAATASFLVNRGGLSLTEP